MKKKEQSAKKSYLQPTCRKIEISEKDVVATSTGASGTWDPDEQDVWDGDIFAPLG